MCPLLRPTVKLAVRPFACPSVRATVRPSPARARRPVNPRVRPFIWFDICPPVLPVSSSASPSIIPLIQCQVVRMVGTSSDSPSKYSSVRTPLAHVDQFVRRIVFPFVGPSVHSPTPSDAFRIPNTPRKCPTVGPNADAQRAVQCTNLVERCLATTRSRFGSSQLFS